VNTEGGGSETSNGIRIEAEFALRRQIPDIELDWLFFAKDFDACLSNVKRRASRPPEDNLRALHKFHHHYQIPIGAQIIQVQDRSRETSIPKTIRGYLSTEMRAEPPKRLLRIVTSAVAN
jgi:hypothetical protein